MKNGLISVTQCLALSGATNYDFVREEDLFKGSEIHKMIELAARGTLDRNTVPEELKGHLAAHDKFIEETGFVSLDIEREVDSKELGLRGRLDRAGLMHGKTAMVDFKSGAIQAAVALQLCLYGHMLNPALWWHRYAVKLNADGSYSVKNFPLMEWSADLSLALACVKISKWKLKAGLV